MTTSEQHTNPKSSNSLQDDLNSLSKERQRPVLLINGRMDDAYAQVVSRHIAPMYEGYNQLSVLLNSRGGSAISTYRMILALRQYVDDVEVLVPRRAKSAATFFCLGADKIYLGIEGELGPLDPQIRDRSGSVRPVSALESFKALEQLLEQSMDSFHAIVLFLRQITRMDVPQAIDQAKPLFAAMMSPLYQQIDPHELGQMGRYLSEIEEYAVRVMKRWSYKDESVDKIQRIVRDLVWEYPSHGFVIDLEEARELGLDVELLDFASQEISVRILDSPDSLIGWGFPTEESEQSGQNCDI